MGVFYHEELPNNPKRCKYLAATLKEVFCHCQTPGRQLSTTSLEEEFPISDLDEEQEVYSPHSLYGFDFSLHTSNHGLKGAN